MSFSLGGKKETRVDTAVTDTKTDPWAPAIPALEDWLARYRAAGSKLGKLTPDEKSSLLALKTIGKEGQPGTDEILRLMNDQFAAQSEAPTVSGAYDRLVSQLMPYASGERIDVTNNPELQRVVQLAGTDVADRIARQWAGAGRDLSSGAAQATARGVAQATAPIMYDATQQEIARQLDASKTLFGAGSETAKTVQALNDAALKTREGGIDSGRAYVEAQAMGPQMVLAVENLLKTLPVEQLAMMAPYLFQFAKLGGTEHGTSTGTRVGSQSGWGFEVEPKTAAQGAGILGRLLPFG